MDDNKVAVLDRNHQEHQLLKQMIDDLNSDIKRIDSEVVQIKRVK